MRNLLKAGFGLAALSVVLASCGSASTPDGSASLRVTDLRTEYIDGTGAFVACDNVTGGFGNTNRTAVAVNFKTSGSVQSADIGLRGQTDNRYDGNYNTNTAQSGLYDLGNGSYQTIFYADASQGFLPQGIIVAPRNVNIKRVAPTSDQVGSFYAALTVYSTSNSSASTDTTLALIPNVKVYPSCAYVSDTGTPL